MAKHIAHCSSTYWDISNHRNADFLQDIRVSHARPLKDLWASKSTSGDDNKLIRLDSFVDWLRKSEFRLMIAIWLVFDTDCTRWS